MKKLSRTKRKEQKKETVYQLSLLDKRRGGQPGNTNAVKHGLYSKKFSPDEIESLAGMSEGLKDEIDVVRVMLKRILDYLDQKRDEETGHLMMSTEDYAAMLNLVTKNAATVARLKQVDKALSDAQNVGIHAQLLAALEDVTQNLLENS